MMMPPGQFDASISEGYVDHPHLSRLTDTSDYDYVGALEALMKGMYSRQLIDDLSVLAVIGKNEADSLLNIVDSTNDIVRHGGAIDWASQQGFGGSGMATAQGIGTTKKITAMTPDLKADFHAGVYHETNVVQSGANPARHVNWDVNGQPETVSLVSNTSAMSVYGLGYAASETHDIFGKKGQISLRCKASVGNTLYYNLNGTAYTKALSSPLGANGRDIPFGFIGFETATPGIYTQCPATFRAPAFWLGKYIDTSTYDTDFYPLILAYLTAVGAN